VSAGRGRILALDLGDVRVGVAVSDPLGVTAQPLPTLRRASPDEDVARIGALVESLGVGRVVVGNPLLLSGEVGARSRQASEFAERLRAALPEVSVELWDERLSTVQAERALIEGNVRRRRRKQSVDAVAAVLILQSYLDAHERRERGA